MVLFNTTEKLQVFSYPVPSRPKQWEQGKPHKFISRYNLLNLTQPYQLKPTSRKAEARRKAICQEQGYLEVIATSTCGETQVLEGPYRPDGLEQACLALKTSICEKKIA